MPLLIPKRWMVGGSSLLPVVLAALVGGSLYWIVPTPSARYLVGPESRKLVPPPPPRIVQDATRATVRVAPDSHGNFIVTVAVKGIPLPMVFDTGASVVALTYEDAVKAGLKPEKERFNQSLETANGIVLAASVVLADFALEGIVQNNVEAYILPPGKLRVSLLGRSSWARLEQGFAVTAGELVLKNDP